ncbi:MAG: hypothetical protein K0S09_315 [Sphingobacteriaceae bacterium]|jgi:hypothetical protein|nr:hypothetical protein [Sphingobacteriaceae bacterium]
MSAKTIFIIIITVLVTIILMKNTDEVRFWIFGDTDVPKLAILGTMFGLGLIVGFLLGRPKRKATATEYDDLDLDKEEEHQPEPVRKSTLSNEDRDYIS